jgi:hypothetical protein
MESNIPAEGEKGSEKIANDSIIKSKFNLAEIHFLQSAAPPKEI